MKRRLFAALVSGALLFSLAACSGGSDTSAAGSHPVSSATASSVEDISATSSSDVSEEAPVEEFVIPEPIIYSGSGDDVVTLDDMEGVWVLSIIGNEEGRHFAVKGYDATGGSTELFVNTTDPYSGTTLDPTLSTKMLEISATGEWQILMHSVYNMDIISPGSALQGKGDTVLLVVDPGLTADISGNSDAHHFAVKTYGSTSDELLVNTTDPYEGTVMLKGDPFLMTINSESDWLITLN